MTSLAIIALIFIILTNAIFSFLVLAKKNKKGYHIAFAFLSAGLSLWAYTNAHFQLTESENTAYILAILSYLSGIIILQSLFFISFIFPDTYKTQIGLGKIYKPYFVISTLLLMTLVFIPGTILESATINENVRKLNTTAGINLYAFILFISIIWFSYNFFSNYRRIKGIKKNQLLFILVGQFATVSGGVFFNLILPLLGNYNFVWLGPCFSIVLTILLGYAILRHRLLNLAIQFQKFLNFVLPPILAIVATTFIVFPISAFIIEMMSTGGHQFSSRLPYIRGTVMLISGFVFNEIFHVLLNKSAFRYFFFRKTYKYYQEFEKLKKTATTILDLDQLIAQLEIIFLQKIRTEKCAIIFFDGNSTTFQTLSNHGFTTEELESIQDIDFQDLQRAFTSHLSYIQEEVIDDEETDVQDQHNKKVISQFFHTTESKVVTSFMLQGKLRGALLLAERKDHKAYTKNDLDLFEELSQTITIALVNSKIYKEETIKGKELEREIEKATLDLKLKLQENKRLSDIKTEFITIISHQLRTPISAIRSSLQLAREDFLGNIDCNNKEKSILYIKGAQDMLRQAYLASENLSGTVEHVLAAFEVVNTSPAVEIRPIESEEFFHRLYLRQKELLEAKNSDITFSFELHKKFPKRILSDEKKLGFAIETLLTNSIFYTSAGTIRYKVFENNNTCVIEVSDTGIGIPKQEQYKIFERFVRLKNAQNIIPDGAGLGLYLSKQYIEAMHGRIEFRSIEGKGTTFTITLPLQYEYGKHM